jgi:hypothetical protein
MSFRRLRAICVKELLHITRDSRSLAMALAVFLGVFIASGRVYRRRIVRRAGGGLGWDKCYEKQLDGIFPLLGDGLAFTRQRLGLSHHS